ncbi:ribosomal RNA small subunit methyltransferase B [Gemmatimonadetes bacterium T265]|nr:ribosomal RNA small subunit methyltransferase B [Gemmatimonadetes bacterium T265]
MTARAAAGRRGPGARPARATAVTPARAGAAAVLADLRDGVLLDAAFERRAAALDARDRRWAHELVWGTLRRRAWLDALLAERVRGGLLRLDPDVVDLLRLGAYQLLAMASVPAYAAIGETVELAKTRAGHGAGALANAVLRRVDRERGPDGVPPVALPDDPLERLALAESHPLWLVTRWAERWGLDATATLLRANNAEAPVVARPYGVSAAALVDALEAFGVVTEPPPDGAAWPADSVRLARGTAVGALLGRDAAAEGRAVGRRMHVQDPASTFVTLYAAFPPGAHAADVCAAPGGKALELARSAAAVYAGDRSPARLARVRANVARLDVPNVFPYAGDVLDAPLRAVDAVLVDAPCTGTGTFRRHPDARWRLKPSDVAVTSAAQHAILRAAAALVRPGGLLVYSTCSIEGEENDDVVDRFLAAGAGEWTLDPPPAGTVPDAVLDRGRLRVLPQQHGVDGAFAARMRRAGAS